MRDEKESGEREEEKRGDREEDWGWERDSSFPPFFIQSAYCPCMLAERHR